MAGELLPSRGMTATQLVPLESVRPLGRGAHEEPRPVLDRLKALERSGEAPRELTLPTLEPGEQYRFHFDMTRCIGCRSCEVACNEQNNNPSHVRWRRVGEIEGGSYPHVRRLHISMSCNHCLEPSCLEGCPVDAYAKLSSGIVTHDAGACIGCQYCTWSCPYGVPQYHPERRVVTKCHLCANRIAGGDLPACVQACPTSAIEIESVRVDHWREAIALGNAPGVPPADLTYSTTRITIPEDLPEGMGRAGSWQLRPEAPHWPLVIFLVLSQWSVGLFAAALGFELLGPFTSAEERRGASLLSAIATLSAFAIGLLSLGASVFHLGRPLHALRALRAWRRSWLSREAVAFLAFAVLGAAAAACALVPGRALLAGGALPLAGAIALGEAFPSGGAPLPGAGPAGGWTVASAEPVLLVLLVLAGIAGVASSVGIYRIPARPAWNTWRTPAQFLLTAVILGGAGALVALSGLEVFSCAGPSVVANSGVSANSGLFASLFAGSALPWCAAFAAAAGAVLQACIPWTLVASGLGAADSALEGTALLLTRSFQRLFWTRALLLGGASFLALSSVCLRAGRGAFPCACGAMCAALAAEIAGRYLFFVTVVPRNMPGHFFSRSSPGGA